VKSLFLPVQKGCADALLLVVVGCLIPAATWRPIRTSLAPLNVISQ